MQLTDTEKPELIEWLISLFSKKHSLSNKVTREEFFRILKADNETKVLDALRNNRTKAKKKEIKKFFLFIEKESQDIAVEAIHAFNGKILTYAEVDAISVWLSDNDFDSKKIAELLSHNHISITCEHSLTFHQYIVNSLSNAQIIAILNNGFIFPDDVTITLINEAVERDCYQFKNNHVATLLKAGKELRLDGYNRYSSEQAEQPYQSVLRDIIDEYNNENITLLSIRDLLTESYERSFQKLLQKFPELSVIDDIHACIALETLLHQPPRDFESNILMSVHTSNNDVPQRSKNPLDYLATYGDMNKAKVLLTHTVNNCLRQKNKEDMIIMIEQCIDNIGSNISVKESEIADDLKSLKMIVNDSGSKKGFSMNHIGYTLLAELTKYTKSELISFAEYDSDSWWNNYTEIAFDTVSILSQESVQSFMETDNYKYMIALMTKAFDSKAYFFILTQSLRIQDVTRCLHDAPEALNILTSSIKEISDEELSSVPDRYKLSALCLVLREDEILAVKLIDSIKSFTAIDSESNTRLSSDAIKDLIPKIKAALLCDTKNISKALFGLQTGVIGRVERGINENQAELTLALTLCVESKGIDYNYNEHFIHIEDDENDEFEVRYDYRNSLRHHIARKYFPRLKNQNAFNQIEIVTQHIKNIGLADACIEESEDSIYEIGFVSGKSAYIFGEFQWQSILTEIKDKDIDQLVFLVASHEDGKAIIKEHKISIKENDLLIFKMVLSAISTNNGIGYPYSVLRELPSPMDDNIRYYLPEISFNGIKINFST